MERIWLSGEAFTVMRLLWKAPSMFDTLLGDKSQVSAPRSSGSVAAEVPGWD